MPGGPRLEQIKPNGFVSREAILSGIEKAKKDQEYWHEQVKQAQLKQETKAKHDYFTEKAYEKIHQLEEYEKKFQKLLDEEIIIDPDKIAGEMISFKGLSESANSSLVYEQGISVLGSEVLRYYSMSPDPRRQFAITEKTETTLRDLFAEFKNFLNEQLVIPEPAPEDIERTQAEVNDVWASYTKAREEVQNLESRLKQEA